jgi:hypothetical protein
MHDVRGREKASKYRCDVQIVENRAAGEPHVRVSVLLSTFIYGSMVIIFGIEGT